MDMVSQPVAKRRGVEGRRAVVAQMMLSGEAYDRVALGQEFGVAVTTIKRDEALIRAEWRRARLADAEQLLAQDLAELGMVKREAWRVYADSREPKWSETEQGTVSSGGGNGAGTSDTSSKTKASAVPNLKALELVTKCLERRQRLLGYGEDQAEKRRDKARVFAFTLKIGDKVLASEASGMGDDEVIEADDAEFYEVDPTGKKFLASGDGTEGGGGEVQ